MSGVCMRAKPLQSCPTLCDPMDYNHPVFSGHGILQARILERVTKPSSRGNPSHLHLLHWQAGSLLLAPPRKPNVLGTILLHTYTQGGASLVPQRVKGLPAMQQKGFDLWVKKIPWTGSKLEMTTNSSILAWKIPWMEEPGRLQSMGSQSQT